ncbi:hypothetical protein [Oerskovia sp. Root22]|uniref:hypothetical protein n=1 Tax=Oerskovia sp. Root22 TaxID=1736494 RepID=UPI000701BBDC|nr:hypothetical protein [Oerskovia sp. Root22]KRC43011.1 hypothetical protein ASE15_03370 [Oerskovia sp. Root22]
MTTPLTQSSEGLTGWLVEVDEHLARQGAFTRADLPGAPWREWFTEGMSPARAVAEALVTRDPDLVWALALILNPPPRPGH